MAGLIGAGVGPGGQFVHAAREGVIAHFEHKFDDALAFPSSRSMACRCEVQAPGRLSLKPGGVPAVLA